MQFLAERDLAACFRRFSGPRGAGPDGYALACACLLGRPPLGAPVAPEAAEMAYGEFRDAVLAEAGAQAQPERLRAQAEGALAQLLGDPPDEHQLECVLRSAAARAGEALADEEAEGLLQALAGPDRRHSIRALADAVVLGYVRARFP